MRVFIVHAHPEPKSFNGALTHTATEILRAHGHEVIVSDLYAADFNPMSDRRNFVTVHDANYFRLPAARTTTAEIARSMRRTRRASPSPRQALAQSRCGSRHVLLPPATIRYATLADHDERYVLRGQPLT
jgi:hypothetical protein